jgi:hypothetical protein
MDLRLVAEGADRLMVYKQVPPPIEQCQSISAGIVGGLNISSGMRAMREGSRGGGVGDRDPCEKSES